MRSILEKWPTIAVALDNMPRSFLRTVHFELLVARAHRRVGNDLGAFRNLNRAQQSFTRNRRLLFLLSELYRDDGQVDHALTFLELAKLFSQEYGVIRKLAFESDHGLLESGQRTLTEILDFSPNQLLRFLQMINRVSVFYPEQTAKLQEVRNRVKSELFCEAYKSPRRWTKRVEYALGCRWWEEARQLLAEGKKRHMPLGKRAKGWFDAIEGRLGCFAQFVDAAWYNEHGSTYRGWNNGELKQFTAEELAPQTTVELFIPTAFFSKLGEEKVTYETVRQTFRTIGETLMEQDDVVVIPRHQLNWRNCRQRLGHRVISYHTHGEPDPKHLRIQESTLSGFCSFDNAGFAGFSSLATDHTPIQRITKDVPTDKLKENQQNLYQHFVDGNVSKYKQSRSDSEQIVGPYVFVALQVPTDVVADLAWMDGATLVQAVASYYRDKETKVVVKRHPYCGSMTMQATIERLEQEGAIQVSKGSVHELIRGADTVFTVNSGVGFESLMHLKPVVVSGQCDYSYAVHAVRNEDELRSLLDRGINADERKILEFLYYYHTAYVVDANSKETIQARLHAWLKS